MKLIVQAPSRGWVIDPEGVNSAFAERYNSELRIANYELNTWSYYD